MKIEHTTTPNNHDIDFLTQKINQQTPEFSAAYPFAFFMRDDKGEIIAGCNGSVAFGAIYTDQLWVHHDYRSKQGFSRKLMGKVYDYANEVGCTMAIVATLSFQGAVKFYESLEYKSDFERPGYIMGSSCIFLRKSLLKDV